jgi:hypothetical protein
LNVRRPFRDEYVWERLSLPIEAVFGASAHPPQAPIWLDPSGCPPGRVFRFGLVSRDPSLDKTLRRLERGNYDARNPAMPDGYLTVDKAENPVVSRSSFNGS